MKKSLVHDERVINERRKITNEAFSLIMFFLIASILVQQLVFKAPFSEYATEFVCFFGASAYILIRNISVGNKLITEDSDRKKIMIRNCLVSGIVITVITGYQLVKDNTSTNEIIFTLGIVFILAVLGSFLSWFTIIKLNQRKIQKLEKELDDEENIEE